MPQLNIQNLDTAGNTIVDYSVDTETLDGPGDQKETYYDNSDWSQWLGYYRTIPELAAAIDAVATWTVGKGFIAGELTTLVLNTIKGWGNDTFNTILENMIRNMYIGGDAFAEIIRDKKGMLINIKPLDPGDIRIVVNRGGIITRYEQRDRQNNSVVAKFQPEEMFHLSRNRVGDEIHGQSIVKVLEKIILMRNEAMDDWQRVMHRNVEPMFIFHLDTDDAARIAKVKEKYNTARKDGENLFVPKGGVEVESVNVATNATLNPLAWIQALNQYFFQACGVPDIILGSSTNLTEASAKIAYLAFQQKIEEDQLFIEENVLSQINLEINLEFPASLENEMISDKPKAEQRPVEKERANQPNDTTAEMEGRK